MRKFLVFDVESIGLHGEAYDVGGVIIDDGVEVQRFRFWCDPERAFGDAPGFAWVGENWEIPLKGSNCQTPREVRDKFWSFWSCYRDELTIAADCPWPVEARFLAQCIDDDRAARQWHGPYPLIDVASVRLAAGLDPLGTDERLPNELPVHNPEADARQSARLLIEALNLIKGK